MKRILLLVSIVFAASAVYAAIDTSSLTKAQVDELSAKVAEMKGSPTTTSALVRQEATAWGELGSNMGKAMVGAAKEVGVAADEFSKTNLGTIVTSIVVYKIIGHDIVKLIVGLGILFVGFIGTALVWKTRFAQVIKYEYKPYLWGFWQRKVTTLSEEETDYTTGRIIISIALFLVTLVSGLSVIF